MNGFYWSLLVAVIITFIFSCIMLYIYKYRKVNEDLVNVKRNKKNTILCILLVGGPLVINAICLILLLLQPLSNPEVKLNQIFFIVSFMAFESAFFALFGKKNTNLLVFAGIILLSIFLFHISLQIEAKVIKNGANQALINWIKIVNSIVFTFQTFTLDLDYVKDFLMNIKYYDEFFNNFGRVMVIVFALIAPATGGFVIIDILANIFPSFKLCLGCIAPWKRKYYIFSELNECSIETAESILTSFNFKIIGMIPVIIFTDVYTNNTAEDSSELLTRAKKLGAICLKQDITELKILRTFNITPKEYNFFFMDKNEENNLKDSISLMSREDEKSILELNYVRNLLKNKVKLFVFTQNSEAPSLLEEVIKKIEDSKDDKNPSVLCKVINEYQNLVYRLIDGWESKEHNEKSYPLYFSKQNEEELDSLTICLIGSGRIGIEFIKAAYWCGQILKNKKEKKTAKLNIIVYSKNASATQKKLQFDMPSISFSSYDQYASFTFVDLEYGTIEFEKEFLNNVPSIDYVLIVLGNDLLNYEAAKWVKRTLDIKNNRKRCIPINYIIEDEKMCKNFNLLKKKPEYKEGCILNSFGSLKSRYTIQNIILQELERDALEADRTHGDANNSEISFLNNFYNRNSSVAVALHIPYKYFSINRNTEGISRKEVCNFKFTDDGGVEIEQLINLLYWLEHRRWIAYINTTGFRCPNPQELQQFINIKSDQDNEAIKKIETKNMFLKYHICLIRGDGALFTLDKLKSELAGAKLWVDGTDKNLIERLRILCDNDPGKGPSSERLEAALKACVPLGDEYDPLDRISILANQDLKKHDIEILQSIIRQQYANIVSQGLETKEFSDNMHLVDIFKDRITCKSKYYYKDETSKTEFIFVTIWNDFLILLAKVENSVEKKIKLKIKLHRKDKTILHQLEKKLFIIGFKLEKNEKSLKDNPIKRQFTLNNSIYDLYVEKKMKYITVESTPSK